MSDTSEEKQILNPLLEYDNSTTEWTSCKRMYEGGQPRCNHSY